MSAVAVVSITVNVLLLVVLLFKREAHHYFAGITEGERPLVPAPRKQMDRPEFRRFIAVRKVDVTGISGKGIPVEGVVFSDGWGVTHWLDRPPMCEPKTEVWHNPGVEPFEKVSGHNGLTTVVWLDEP